MKDIKGYEGLYAITDQGEVWSYFMKAFRKLTTCTHGYHTVRLCKNSTQKVFQVHRLVAEAYIPNPEGLPLVRHIDGNRTNNHVSNLEWCIKEITDDYDIGRTYKKKPVYCVELDRTFESISEAARAVGVDRNGIIWALRGKSKTAGGYHWKLA